MATAGEVKEFEILKCPVCLTSFNNPRILPCLHTICENCIRLNIESQGQNNAQFMCPICKASTAPSAAGLPVDRWIHEFIPDSTIKSLMDKIESPDNKEDRCDACELEGETTTVWCVVCQEKLCDPCAKYNKRKKATSNHNTVSVHEMGKTYVKTHLSAGSNVERSCARHPGKPLELFCVDHRELCCVLCLASNHRECNNIQDIDDIVKEQAKGFAYNKVLEHLMNVETEMNKVITDKNDNIVQITQEKENIINEMDVIVDRIIVKLNELRNSFRNEAGHLQEAGKRSLLRCCKIIQGFGANVVNSCNILENVNSVESTRQKFVVFETIRSQIISHFQELQKDLKDDLEIHLILKPNKALRVMEQSLDSLGVVEVTMKTNTVLEDSLNNIDKDNIKILNSRTQFSTPVYSAQVAKIDVMTSTATLLKTVTQQNLGKGTDITGGTFLRDGRLVMSDYSNKMLLELDDDFKIVREHKLDGAPRDVAAGNKKNEIYISLCSNNFYIYQCTLDTGLTIKQKIVVQLETWGIALSDNTIIAGAADAILLISPEGWPVKSIPKSGISYCYVAVSHTPTSFYHRDGDSVVGRTFDGKEIFRFKNENC